MINPPRWVNVRTAARVIQILPIADLCPHTETPQCACGPKVEKYDHSCLIIHRSFDGRELVEQHGLQ